MTATAIDSHGLGLDKTTWNRLRFGDFVQQVSDRVDDPSAAGVDRYVGLEHLDAGALTLSRWGSPDQVNAQKLRFRSGDVIFGKRRAYQKKLARADFDGICSAHAFVFRAIPSVIHPDFLPIFLSSDYFFDRAVEISVGSLSPTINWRDLRVQEFDLPGIEQQKQIADLHWALEAERRALVSLRASMETVREVCVDRHFLHSGTGTLKDLCGDDGIRIGPFGAQLHAYDYVEDGECPVIMPQDMVNGAVSVAGIQRINEAKAAELKAYKVEVGDILLPRRGELDRRALITEAECGWLCGTGSVRIRLRADVPVQAVFLALSSSATVAWLKTNATGTTMPNLNVGIVSRIPVSIPDGAELEAALSEIGAIETALSHIASRFESVSRLRSHLLADTVGGAA